jgi:site-specific DNA-methyltransferase (adenine-specific)
LPLKEYLEFLNKTFTLCIDKLNEGGHLGIQIANTGRQPYTPLTDFVSTQLFDKIQMRGEIIWDKQNMTSATAWGSWLSSNCPSLRDSHEYIEVFRKEGNRKGKSDITKEEFMEATKAIWNITPETQQKEHPAPFPLSLAMRFIRLYAFIDETVLDCFGGSGTVALACEKLNRKWILIELSEGYCSLIKNRVEAYTNQLRMF